MRYWILINNEPLNANTSKLADKVESIDKRVVRIETMVEIAQTNPQRISIKD